MTDWCLDPKPKYNLCMKQKPRIPNVLKENIWLLAMHRSNEKLATVKTCVCALFDNYGVIVKCVSMYKM